MTKRCGACGQEKPTTEFWRNANTTDGLQFACKPCHNRASRRWQQQNADRFRSIRHAYYERNKGKVMDYQRAYRQRRREQQTQEAS